MSLATVAWFVHDELTRQIQIPVIDVLFDAVVMLYRSVYVPDSHDVLPTPPLVCMNVASSDDPAGISNAFSFDPAVPPWMSSVWAFVDATVPVAQACIAPQSTAVSVCV